MMVSAVHLHLRQPVLISARIGKCNCKAQSSSSQLVTCAQHLPGQLLLGDCTWQDSSSVTKLHLAGLQCSHKAAAGLADHHC